MHGTCYNGIVSNCTPIKGKVIIILFQYCCKPIIPIAIFYRIILEADSGAVVQRVALRTDDIPIGEQTVAQVSWFYLTH